MAWAFASVLTLLLSLSLSLSLSGRDNGEEEEGRRKEWLNKSEDKTKDHPQRFGENTNITTHPNVPKTCATEGGGEQWIVQGCQKAIMKVLWEPDPRPNRGNFPCKIYTRSAPHIWAKKTEKMLYSKRQIAECTACLHVWWSPFQHTPCRIKTSRI